MKELLLASHNSHKRKEIEAILPEGYIIYDLKDLGFYEDIEETGSRLEENALLKARFLYDKLHKPCIAEDSGLEVNALGGAPGVFSARYAGEEKSSLANMEKLLKEMEGISDRKARFRTVLALVLDGEEFLFEGELEGHIAYEIKGVHGFGYDPVFIPESFEKSFGELDPQIKLKLSHRSQALEKLLSFLQLRNKNQ